jgi:drug/metabolite transporter (DMT)-like permease
MSRKETLMAWLALIAGIGLQAVTTALLGFSFTAADSLLMLALAAAACTLLGAVVARGDRCALLEHKQGVRALIWLNVWTAISFVAFFLGVAVHSATVVFTLEASFAPLAVTTWAVFRARRNGGEARPGPAQRWAACMLAVLGTSLVLVMAQSDSGGMVALGSAAAFGIIAGVAAGAVVIVSRGLGRSGLGVSQAMAHRFYATVVFAATVLLTLVPSGLLAPPALDVGLIGGAALACLVGPLFLLQYAMQRLSPVSVTAALATMPTITIASELASGRAVNWMVLSLGLLIVPGNLALIVTEQQQKRALPWVSQLPTTIFDIEHRPQPAATTV